MRAIPEAARGAVDKYREFHRLEPTRIGSFRPGFQIPATLYRAGPAKWVTYRSSKVDPETLRRPSRAVNYIHDHDAGVVVYVADARVGREAVPVPDAFRDVPALVRLGHCLGFCVKGGAEAEATSPLPDLYATPNGKCLLVIQSRRSVLAMMWGGGLGVYARGIDG